MLELVRYMAIVVSMLLFWYFSHPFFHELGHYYRANKYIKTNGLIVVRWFWDAKYLKIDSKRLKIRFRKLKGFGGKAYVKNEFIGYNAKQMKKIASAGRDFQLYYGIFLVIVWLIFYISLFKPNTFEYIMVGTIVFANLLGYLLVSSFLIESIFYKKKESWPDYKIYKNPEEFLKCCLTSDDTYQNAMIKYKVN